MVWAAVNERRWATGSIGELCVGARNSDALTDLPVARTKMGAAGPT